MFLSAGRRLGVVLALLSSTLALPARAQGEGGDASRAETLFYEGRKATDAGDHATACKKFAESLALLRRASTLVNLAQCEDRLGKLTDSRKHAEDALSLLPPEDERMAAAKQLVDDLSLRVPRVTLKLPADLPAGAAIRIDGAEIERARWTQPLPLDPGEHTLVLSAPSHEDAASKVVLLERDRKEIALAPGPKKDAAPAPTGTAPDAGRGASPDDSRGTRRTLGFVAGGVGLAGLVAAGITGGLVVANDSTIQANCPNKVCNAAGRDAISQTGGLVIGNYVGFAVGGVGLAAGAVLILTSLGGEKDKTAVSVHVSPSSMGLVWQGAFQ